MSEQVIVEPTETRCNCKLCQKYMRANNVIDRRDPDELIALVDELMDDYLHVSFDLDWHEAIRDGSWPDSVEILERWLANAKAKVAKVETSCV